MIGIDGLERVSFDFSEGGGLGAVKHLEGILRSGHWSDRGLNYEDEQTMLLLRLLRIGGIAVYKRGYSRKADSPELRRRAEDINMFMNKRHVGQTLLDIAGIFSEYEFDGRRTEFNSLFFPELKAFVRYDGLPPERLLELLEKDGCEMVIHFPETSAGEDDVFYAFMLAMPKALFLEELEKTNERIMESIHDALQKANEKMGDIFPQISIWPEDE